MKLLEIIEWQSGAAQLLSPYAAATLFNPLINLNDTSEKSVFVCLYFTITLIL